MGDSELTSACILMPLRDGPLVLGSTIFIWIINAPSICRLKHSVIPQSFPKVLPVTMIIQSNTEVAFILQQ